MGGTDKSGAFTERKAARVSLKTKCRRFVPYVLPELTFFFFSFLMTRRGGFNGYVCSGEQSSLFMHRCIHTRDARRSRSNGGKCCRAAWSVSNR